MKYYVIFVDDPCDNKLQYDSLTLYTLLIKVTTCYKLNFNPKLITIRNLYYLKLNLIFIYYNILLQG